MPSTISRRLLGRVAGATVTAGLALAGLVVTAAPASAAACTGTSGVTVVVDRSGSTSTRCASGDPSSALKALTAAGFAVTYPQQYPGSVVCRIDGYPGSDPCVQMPPGDAYWAFFHAKRGGSWVYSSSGVGSYDPAPGTVVGFRFGSGQQPSIAPPAPTKTSEPAPTRTTSEPDRTTAAPKATTRTTAPRSTAPRTPASTTAAGGTASPTSGASRSATPSASPTGSPSTTASASPSTSAGGTTSTETLAAAATSAEADGSSGPGTLLAGGALLVLVAGGAGWAAWKRRP